MKPKTSCNAFQVIDGGDLDIDFKISGPKGNPIVTEFRRNDGVHT